MFRWSQYCTTCFVSSRVVASLILEPGHANLPHNYTGVYICTCCTFRCTQLQKSAIMDFQGSTFFLVWFRNFLTCKKEIYTVWLILEQIIANLSFWSCRHLKSKTYLVSITSHGTRTCIKRKKITHGNFFDFCAEKCI